MGQRIGTVMGTMGLRDHGGHHGAESWGHGGHHGVGRAWWASRGWKAMMGLHGVGRPWWASQGWATMGQRVGAVVGTMGLEDPGGHHGAESWQTMVGTMGLEDPGGHHGAELGRGGHHGVWRR